MSLEELCEKIADHATRDGSARSSKSAQVACAQIKTFANHFDAHDDIVSMLNNYEAIGNYLKNKRTSKKQPLAVNTLKTYYASLKLGAEVSGASSDAVKFYTDNMLMNANVINEEVKENYIPEKFGNAYPPWSDISDITSKYVGDVKYKEKHLITALYTLIPPRRLEYRLLTYLTDKPNKDPTPKPPRAKGWTDGNDIPFNYIYPNGSTYDMVLCDFKTVKTYGVYTTTLPQSLADIIKAFIKKQKIQNGDLFFKKPIKQEPYGDNRFSEIVSEAFGLRYKKFVLTCDDIRHIYITSLHNNEFKVNNKLYNQMTVREKEVLSNACGHSISKADEYRGIQPRPQKKGRTAKVVSDSDSDSEPEQSGPSPIEPSQPEASCSACASAERGATVDVQNDSVPSTEVVQGIHDETDKEKLIRLMTEYYELKIKLLKKQLDIVL